MKKENLKKFEINKNILKDFDDLMSLRLDSVEELVVSEIDSESKLLNIVGLCTSLKTLVIQGDQKVNIDTVISSVCNPELLEILILNNAKFPKASSSEKLVNLKMILLNNIKYGNVAKFLKDIPNPEKIQGVSFSDVDFGGGCIDCLERYSNLEYLNLANIDNCKWSNLAFISRNKKLKKLIIKNNKIDISEIKNLLNGNYIKDIFVKINIEDSKSGSKDILKITKDGTATVTARASSLRQITEELNLSKVNNLIILLNRKNNICKYEKKLIKVNNISIVVKDISSININEAVELRDRILVKNIYFNDLSESGKENYYNIDSYIRIRKELDNIINLVPKHLNEIEKFLEMYRIFGQTMKLDEMQTEEIIDVKNLETALKERKFNTLMYGQIFHYCLSCLGITSKIIKGTLNDNEKPHLWSQIKMDDDWYNIDIALDAPYLLQKKKVRYCLIQDKLFYKTHTPKTKDRYYAAENYDERVIRRCLYKRKATIFRKLINKIKMTFLYNSEYALLEAGLYDDEDDE